MLPKAPIKNHKPKHHNSYAFTLVELIVVITILAILSVIAFVSVGNFSSNARDSIRISDIKSLHQWLIISKTRTWEYPLPENAIEIRDISNILSYQWYAWEAATRLSRINKTPLDPKDIVRYVYLVNANQTKLQLMGYLESWDTAKMVSYADIFKISFNNLTNQIQNNLTNQALAATTNIDYRSRFIYTLWDKLWVLTDENKTPIQETTTATGVNLSITNSWYIAYFWWNTFWAGQSTGTGQILIDQIISVQNNTLPCDALSYWGYTITPLLHEETGIFTKPLTITNGSWIWSLQVQCINGSLDIAHSIETPSITCNSNYVNQSNVCVLDVCGGIMPNDAQILPGSTQTVSQNWTRNTVAGICTFDCKTWYTWIDGSSSCLDQTPPTITSIMATSPVTQPACNTVRFTIVWASDTVALHSTPYSFDGGTTWQTTSYRDYTGTSLTKVPNDFKVKDTTGNIYTYTSSVSGSANSCAVNCSYTTYQWWSCSVSCGGGNYAKYYTKTIVESGGGTCAVAEGQFAGYIGSSCNTQACSTSGPYSYGAWGACSKTCGWWTQTRAQSCNYDNCYSPQITSQSCNTQTCCVATVGQNCVKWCDYWMCVAHEATTVCSNGCYYGTCGPVGNSCVCGCSLWTVACNGTCQ